MVGDGRRCEIFGGGRGGGNGGGFRGKGKKERKMKVQTKKMGFFCVFDDV